MAVEADRKRLSLGTLGGPMTFAGTVTVELRALYPELDEPVYYPGGSALFAALKAGEIEAAVVAGANLNAGYTDLNAELAAPDSKLYVVAHAQLPFRCSILAKPGSTPSGITRVYGGPASIGIARAFLAEHLPQAEIRIYEEPLATAQEIADGAGNLAVLGTKLLAEKFGLDLLYADIDEGALNGDWIALSTRPLFDSEPDLVFVAGRIPDDGTLGGVAATMKAAGYRLSSVYSKPTGRELLEGDYVLRFVGRGSLAGLQAAISSLGHLRLAGALKRRTGSKGG